MFWPGWTPSKVRRAGLRAAMIGALLAVLLSDGRAQDAIGDVYASDASVKGAVVLAGGGTRVLSGSTVSAGMGAATVKLTRGGLLRVCPGTNLSVSTSQNGLSLGFSNGAVELHYDVAANADALQTPDFRMLLAGPGAFHLAISADALGNTCVRSLPQNDASIIVQELFGDATYQVKPKEEVLFRRGHVREMTHEVPPDCGCPASPARPEQLAEAAPPSPQTDNAPARLRDALPSGSGSMGLTAPAEPARLEAASAPAPAPATHLEVEAPFVYHGDSSIPEPPMVAIVQISDRAPALAMETRVLPPPAAKTEPAVAFSEAKPMPHRHFVGRLRSFFAAIFK